MAIDELPVLGDKPTPNNAFESLKQLLVDSERRFGFIRNAVQAIVLDDEIYRRIEMDLMRDLQRVLNVIPTSGDGIKLNLLGNDYRVWPRSLFDRAIRNLSRSVTTHELMRMAEVRFTQDFESEMGRLPKGSEQLAVDPDNLVRYMRDTKAVLDAIGIVVSDD